MIEPHAHRLNIDGPVATITLDRPAAANAVTRGLLRSLGATLDAVGRDSAVRAIVLTGAGRSFCAGQALDDAETLGPAGPIDLFGAVADGFNPVVRALLTLEKPIVAAVNGVAAGAGFGFALACDFRVVSEAASFATAFVKIGLVPDSGVSFLLPRMIGYAKALEFCLLGEPIDVATASALGLVTKCVAPGDVVSQAQALAAQLAAGPSCLGLIKRGLVRNGLADLDAALAYEAALQHRAGSSSDAREGIAAFREKRLPHFLGTTNER